MFDIPEEQESRFSSLADLHAQGPVKENKLDISSQIIAEISQSYISEENKESSKNEKYRYESHNSQNDFLSQTIPKRYGIPNPVNTHNKLMNLPPIDLGLVTFRKPCNNENNITS